MNTNTTIETAEKRFDFVEDSERRLTDAIDRAKATTASCETAEGRRERRRQDMEITRLMSMDVAARIAETFAGRLPEYNAPLLARIKDPVSALATLNRSIVQIAMYEDRLDETTEERTARIVAEAEAKVKTERAAQAQRDRTAAQIRRVENRRLVQYAVREITLPSLDAWSFGQRARLFDRLFDRLDKEPDRYDMDPAQVVAEIVDSLGLAANLTAIGKDTLAAAAERRKHLAAAAREQIAALSGPDPTDTGDDGPAVLPPQSTPPAHAQGPP